MNDATLHVANNITHPIIYGIKVFLYSAFSSALPSIYLIPIIDKAIIGCDSIIRKLSQIGDGNEIFVVGDREDIKANSILSEIKEVI